VKITIETTEKNWLYRLLTIVIFRTNNHKRVAKSKFMYGKNSRGYFLRPLGILHAWVGLTFNLPEITKKLEDV
jgi:hypothetical protein